MSIFNNKLPGDFSRKKNDRVAAAAMRLWLCSWPRLWHLILGGRGGGEKEARKHYHHHHVSIRYTRGWLLFSSQIEQPNSQSEPRPRCSHWAGTQRLLAPHWRGGWTTGGRMEHQSAPPRPHRWWATWNNKQKLGFRQSGEVHHEAPLFLPPKEHTSQMSLAMYRVETQIRTSCHEKEIFTNLYSGCLDHFKLFGLKSTGSNK